MCRRRGGGCHTTGCTMCWGWALRTTAPAPQAASCACWSEVCGQALLPIINPQPGRLPRSVLTVHPCTQSCCPLQVILLHGLREPAEGPIARGANLLCHFCRHQEHLSYVPRHRVPAGADVAGDRGGGVGAVAHVPPRGGRDRGGDVADLHRLHRRHDPGSMPLCPFSASTDALPLCP